MRMRKSFDLRAPPHIVIHGILSHKLLKKKQVFEPQPSIYKF